MCTVRHTWQNSLYPLWCPFNVLLKSQANLDLPFEVFLKEYLFIYLFIHGLFNNTTSSPEYRCDASKSRRTKQSMNKPGPALRAVAGYSS